MPLDDTQLKIARRQDLLEQIFFGLRDLPLLGAQGCSPENLR